MSPGRMPAGSGTGTRACGVWKACVSGTGVSVLIYRSKDAAGVT